MTWPKLFYTQITEPQPSSSSGPSAEAPPKSPARILPVVTAILFSRRAAEPPAQGHRLLGAPGGLQSVAAFPVSLRTPPDAEAALGIREHPPRPPLL